MGRLWAIRGQGEGDSRALREAAGEVDGEAGVAALEEALFDLRLELSKGRRALSILPRLASMLGALGALYQLLWLHAGDHGLDGLVAGLPEELARERAFLSVTLGLGTWLLGGLSSRWIGSSSRRLYSAARGEVEEARSRCERGPEGHVDPALRPVLESERGRHGAFSKNFPASG